MVQSIENQQYENNLGGGYLDALRGTAMFLVVFSHSITYGMGLNGYDENFLEAFFGTSYLPLFFFISGILGYKPLNNWTPQFYFNSIRKKALLIVPATVFYILYCITFGKFLFGFLTHGWSLYWFTIVLFEMFFLYYTISVFARYTHKALLEILLVIISVFGVLWVAFINRKNGIFEVLSINSLTKYFQFFALGILVQKYKDSFLRIVNCDWFKTIVVVGFFGSLFLYFDKDFSLGHPILFKLVHDVIIRYCGLLVVFVFFLTHADYFEKQSIIPSSFRLVGRRTLDIYMLHYFFMPNLTILTVWLSSTKQSLLLFVVIFFVATAMVAMSLLFGEVIRSSKFLGHYLFGAKRL